ncbi:MAG: HNH endonuclease [Thiobacillus sp.]
MEKLPKPPILADNEDIWLEEFLSDRKNKTKRYRYRHSEIKATLREETFDKCVYCESKLGHSSPGDVEHKMPSSKVPEKHFDWDNLTMACQECNRRKNAFYDAHDGFIDPYVDDVEAMLEHLGPVVTWKTGEARAEISVGILELSSDARIKLFTRKIEKLRELCHILERFEVATGPLKGLLSRQIKEMAKTNAEYSAMVKSALIAKGYAPLL